MKLNFTVDGGVAVYVVCVDGSYYINAKADATDSFLDDGGCWTDDIKEAHSEPFESAAAAWAAQWADKVDCWHLFPTRNKEEYETVLNRLEEIGGYDNIGSMRTGVYENIVTMIHKDGSKRVDGPYTNHSNRGVTDPEKLKSDTKKYVFGNYELLMSTEDYSPQNKTYPYTSGKYEDSIPNPHKDTGMSNEKALVKALTDLLKGGDTAKDVDIRRDKGVKQIILPDGMSEAEAIKWLDAKQKDNAKKVAVLETVDCFPLDGVVALYDVLADLYGFVEKVPTPGFWGDNPPMMIGVPVGPGKTQQVPWGRVTIPGIKGYLETSMAADPHPKFVLKGEVQQGDLRRVREIVDLTKERLRTHSIYQGKAIELDLGWMRAKVPFHPLTHAPKFNIPLDGATEDRLVLSKEVEQAIRTSLFTPIDHAQMCARHGVPVKRGILMSGRFGVGKSLTGWVAAKKAVDAGMTFIFVKSVLDLAPAFAFARQYQHPKGVVVFAEDLDTVIGEHASETMEELRNAFDSVSTKTDQIITILTTNRIEVIQDKSQALVRPGRIDLVVEVTTPDAEAAARLVLLYGGDLLAKDINLKLVGEALKGHIPAEIREAVERSKLDCIARMAKSQGDLLDERSASITGQITADDIAFATQTMDMQHKMLQPKAEDHRSSEEKAFGVLGHSIERATEHIVQSVLHIGGAIRPPYDQDEFAPAIEGRDDFDDDFDE